MLGNISHMRCSSTWLLFDEVWLHKQTSLFGFSMLWRIWTWWISALNLKMIALPQKLQREATVVYTYQSFTAVASPLAWTRIFVCNYERLVQSEQDFHVMLRNTWLFSVVHLCPASVSYSSLSLDGCLVLRCSDSTRICRLYELGQKILLWKRNAHSLTAVESLLVLSLLVVLYLHAQQQHQV